MSRRSVSLLFAGTWLVALAYGCSKVSEAPELGTNTNWLKTCSEQSECGARSCVCGVCTSVCSADAQCSAVHDATSCRAVSATACGSIAPTPMAACLQGCRADRDCSALEKGRCLDGLCVPVARLGTEPKQEPTTSGPSSEPEPVTGGSITEPEPVMGGPSVDPLYALERVGANVAVTDAYTACERDSECALVGTSCNGCCELAAINNGLSYLYDPARARACSDYRGAICDCSFPDLVARCEAGRCRTAPRDTATCFSPTQNQKRAFEEGAIGCRCLRRDDTICTGGAAIRCADENKYLLAWRLSESRPCEPKPENTCNAEQRRGSATQCLADFVGCFELVGGDHCGLLSR